MVSLSLIIAALTAEMRELVKIRDADKDAQGEKHMKGILKLIWRKLYCFTVLFGSVLFYFIVLLSLFKYSRVNNAFLKSLSSCSLYLPKRYSQEVWKA